MWAQSKACCSEQRERAREHLLLLKHLWETPLFFTRFIGNQWHFWGNFFRLEKSCLTLWKQTPAYNRNFPVY